MDFKTYGELRLQVQKETDTEAEDFIDSDEIKEYFDSAINECEAHIHKLGIEDEYFLAFQSFDLVVGQESLSLPTDIYANKIRQVLFKRQNEIYPIKRLKRQERFEWLETANLSQKSSTYNYMLINPASGPKLLLVPSSWHEGVGIIKVWYVRNMNKVQDDSTVIDVPEFYSFIKAFVKWKIYQKEGSVREESAKAELEEQRALMIQTLENQVVDEDNKIDGDYTSYEEHT